MTKHELELKKLVIGAEKFTQVLGLIKHVFTLATIAGCIYLIFNGLTEIAKANPASLSALSQVLEKLNLSSVLSYIIAIGSSVGWVYERKGKKRLLKGVDKNRQDVEANDPFNGSSGLTETGDTP
ncbi:MAG TPA: hypothetical protein VF427_00150 [Noviherbaspirillum sp.]